MIVFTTTVVSFPDDTRDYGDFLMAISTVGYSTFFRIGGECPSLVSAYHSTSLATKSLRYFLRRVSGYKRFAALLTDYCVLYLRLFDM